MADVGIRKKLDLSFNEALERVPEALKTEGFGVLTEINVTQTLKDKINADIRPYRVLGACNPGLANQALSQEPAAGVLIPCNVAVFEDDDGKAVVVAVDPMQTAAGLQPGDGLREFAKGVRESLVRVIDSL